jgi:hypothetical protein
MTKTDPSRASRNSDSISAATTISPIENGRRMLKRHSLLVISVFLSTIADLLSRSVINNEQMTGVENHTL